MSNASERHIKPIIDYLETHSIGETARHFGVQRTTIHSYRKKWRQLGHKLPDKRYKKNDNDDINTDNISSDQHISQEYSKDKAFITTKSLNIQSVDDALEVSKVNLKEWKISKHTINTWETTTKLRKYEKDKDGNVIRVNDQPETYTNYQVKVWLERIKQTEDEVAVEKLIKQLYKRPLEHKPVYYQDVQSPHMLEISLFDHHFGMLAWGEETGTDYDLKIAEDLYINSVVKILKRTKHYNFDKIVIPLGNDFFHINSPDNLTPVGKNRLDVDTRLAKILEVGERAVMKAVEQCRLIAPVEVLWVPGNHDPETSYYLTKIIKAYYHNSEDVKVDCSPQLRKYIRYGDTLIGFTHGNEEPHNKLPTIMAEEMPREWADTKFREWHTGHFHKKKQMEFISTNSYGGTIVRILPSLSGTDYWHYKKGYIGKNRAAECFVYSRKEGPVGYFSVSG